MVGWSRRNREDAGRRRRFARWWDSLTEEQKEEHRRQAEAEWRRERPIFLAVIATGVLMLIFLIIGATR